MTRVNALLTSDDTTLDELQELVNYVKSNKSLIDAITTSKVNVSDIIDNLVSTSTNKPLSANQGRALKALITALEQSLATHKTAYDTKVAELQKILWRLKQTISTHSTCCLWRLVGHSIPMSMMIL